MGRAAALADERDPPAGAADARRRGKRRGRRAADPPAGERGRGQRRADPRRSCASAAAARPSSPPSSAASWSRRVGGHGGAPDLADHRGEAAVAQPFLHHRQHLLVVAAFGVEQAVGRQPRLRQARARTDRGRRSAQSTGAPRRRSARRARRGTGWRRHRRWARASRRPPRAAPPPSPPPASRASTASMPNGRHGRPRPQPAHSIARISARKAASRSARAGLTA